MIGLTRLQADCVRVIDELTGALGKAPSYREVQREMDLKSVGQVQWLAARLRERGWLEQGRKLILLHRLPPIEDCDVELTDAGREAVAA